MQHNEIECNDRSSACSALYFVYACVDILFIQWRKIIILSTKQNETKRRKKFAISHKCSKNKSRRMRDTPNPNTWSFVICDSVVAMRVFRFFFFACRHNGIQSQMVIDFKLSSSLYQSDKWLYNNEHSDEKQNTHRIAFRSLLLYRVWKILIALLIAPTHPSKSDRINDDDAMPFWTTQDFSFWMNFFGFRLIFQAPIRDR